MSEQTKIETTPQTAQKKEVQKLSPTQKWIASAKQTFEKSNEYNLDFTREANFALQILEGNPYLQKAKGESIKNAIINTALTGISLNPALKFAYLVPRKIGQDLHCVLDISYMGMIKILTDAGAVKSIDADVIYSNDSFEIQKGTELTFKHSPEILRERGEMVAAYAIAYFRDGGSQFVVLRKDEIEEVRATSESWKNEKGRKYSPWETFTGEMWKKTALKRLFKLLPKTHFSENLIAALSNEHENEMNDISEKDERRTEIFEDYDNAMVVD